MEVLACGEKEQVLVFHTMKMHYKFASEQIVPKPLICSSIKAGYERDSALVRKKPQEGLHND